MNRFKIRLPIRPSPIVGLVALVAALLSGCGAGQISQTATQEPAVNGNKATINNVALRDIHMQAAQTGDFLQPGRTVDLVLVAINQSPDIKDRLGRHHQRHRHGDGQPATPHCPPAGCCSSVRRTAKQVAPGPDRLQQRGQGDRRPGQADHATASTTPSPSTSRRPARPACRCRSRPPADAAPQQV